VLAIALLACAGWVVFATSLLSVRDIEVTGSTIVSPDQIRAVADVPAGTPLARVDTGAVRQRVRALAPVADADVSRSWPGTLVIAVTERQPVAVVRTSPGYQVLDGSGVVFNAVAVRPAGVVLLQVAKPGPGDPATTAGLQVIAALTPQLRRVVKQVDAPTPDDIQLDLIDGRTVVWGGADQSPRKAQIATLLLNRAKTRLDVSAPDEVVAS
jgi:cell division protein FtsQ